MKKKIINPPKQKPAKVYGGSSRRPLSIRAQKLRRDYQFDYSRAKPNRFALGQAWVSKITNEDE